MKIGKIPTREYATVFDVEIKVSENNDISKPSTLWVGGVSNWEYYQDAKTGEIYKVAWHDSASYSRNAYTAADNEYLNSCYKAIKQRFRRAAEESAAEIRISRNELISIQGFTYYGVFTTPDGYWVNDDTRKELINGKIGEFKGIPVVCDLHKTDELPTR